MHADDPVLDLMGRFTAALNAHDLDAVLALVTDDIVFESTRRHPTAPATRAGTRWPRPWGQVLAATSRARFDVEEQFTDGSDRAFVGWRYDWGDPGDP